MPQLDTGSFWEITIFTFFVYFMLYIMFDLYGRNINFYEKCIGYKKILSFGIIEKITYARKQLNSYILINNKMIYFS